MTQRYEIEAWLGDHHALTDDQIDELVRISDEINQRYPDPDDQEERTAALFTAYRLMSEDEAPGVVEDLAGQLAAARVAEVRALAGLRQAAAALVPDRESESSFARRAGVDRMTVRAWLGKRS